MNRLLIRIAVALASSAVAFVIADVVLDSFVVSYPAGLVFPVILFTAATVLLAPVVEAMVKQHASSASILIGVIITWLALLITELLTDSLSIEGVLTWVLATVIVWLASVVTALVMRGVTGVNRGADGS